MVRKIEIQENEEKKVRKCCEQERRERRNEKRIEIKKNT